MNDAKLNEKVREMMVTTRQAADLLDDLLMMARDVDYELSSQLRRKSADDDIYEASQASYLILSTLLTLNGKMEELILAIDTLLWPFIKRK